MTPPTTKQTRNTFSASRQRSKAPDFAWTSTSFAISRRHVSGGTSTTGGGAAYQGSPARLSESPPATPTQDAGFASPVKTTRWPGASRQSGARKTNVFAASPSLRTAVRVAFSPSTDTSTSPGPTRPTRGDAASTSTTFTLSNVRPNGPAGAATLNVPSPFSAETGCAAMTGSASAETGCAAMTVSASAVTGCAAMTVSASAVTGCVAATWP